MYLLSKPRRTRDVIPRPDSIRAINVENWNAIVFCNTLKDNIDQEKYFFRPLYNVQNTFVTG